MSTTAMTIADIARNKINTYSNGHKFTNDELAAEVGCKPAAIRTLYGPSLKAGHLSVKKERINGKLTRVFTKHSNVELVHKYGKIHIHKQHREQPLFNNFSEPHYQFAYGGKLREQPALNSFTQLRAA